VANVHVVIAEIANVDAAFSASLADTLDGVHVAGNPGQNGRRITGSGRRISRTLFAPSSARASIMNATMYGCEIV
jgi:hypothetical protein